MIMFLQSTNERKHDVSEIMRLSMPGKDGKSFAYVFLDERTSSRGSNKAPRRTHKDLDSFAQWVYDEVGSQNKTSRRFCMEMLPGLCGVFPEITPREWIRARTLSGAAASSFAHRFEDDVLRERPAKGEPLKTMTKRYASLETTIDVYSWLLRGDYARPSDLFVDESCLVRNVEGFVRESELPIDSVFKTAMPSELRRHALQRSKCLYAFLKLVNTTVTTYGKLEKERSKIPPQFVSRDTLRMVLLSVLAPGAALGLDTVSDPVVDIEIPKMCQELCRALRDESGCKKWYEDMQVALSDIVEERPHLGLGDPQQCLQEMGSDGFAMLLRGHLHLSFSQVTVSRSDGGSLFEKGVMQWAWDKHYNVTGAFEPSFKVLMIPLLQLALQQLENPNKVWQLLFGGLGSQATQYWRETKEWAFYLEVRENIDSFLGNRIDLSKFVLGSIGKVGKEYAAAVLHNVIDCQCRILSDPVAEEQGVAVKVGRRIVKVCTDNDASWMKHLLQSRPNAGGLPSWANSQDEYDFQRRKSAVEVLGKLLSLISLLSEREDGCLSASASDGSMASASGNVHQGILDVLRQVLDKERDCFISLRKQGKVADTDVLVRLLEALGPIFSCATRSQAADMVQAVKDVLGDEHILPWDVSRAMSMEERSAFAPVFSSLLQLIRASKSSAVLPLIEEHLLKDLEKHPLKEDIWSTIDEYTLQMTDEEALKMASEIFRRSQHLVDDDGVLFQNVNVLRVQRSVIEQICGRLLRRLSPESLIRFFTECLPSVFATFKKGGDRGFGPTGGKPFNGTIAEMNQVICVMQVLDALYAVMPYEEIQEKVHIHASVTEDTLKDVTGVKKNPTLLFITRLSNMRRLSMTPRQKEEEAFVEIWSLLVRYAVRSYATLVCCTQSKLKILQTVFKLETAEWLKVVGEGQVQLVASSQGMLLEESSDGLSALRRQHHYRTSVLASQKSSQRGSQMGSLTQDMGSMPRTLLGDALAADGVMSGFAPADLASEDVVLVQDDLNRNEAMRALVKSLFVIQEKFPMGVDSEVPAGQMPPWMKDLLDVLNAASKSEPLYNVQLFIVKLIINYYKNLQRRRAAGASIKDMFRPHAAHFFDAFFNEKTGLANRLSKYGHADISQEDVSHNKHFDKLQDTFTFLLKDICSLWESWIAAPEKRLSASCSQEISAADGFKIDRCQARHGWAFIFNLMRIASSNSTSEANDNVFFLKAFIRAWRLDAKTEELDDCLINGAGMYLKTYKTLLSEKAKRDQDAKLIKTLEIAIRAGMSLLKQFLDEEINLHSELLQSGQGHLMGVQRISEATLDKMLDSMIKMMMPDQHKNKENRKYNKFFKHAAEAAGKVLQCFRNLSDSVSAVGAGAGTRGDAASKEASKVSKVESKLLEKVKDIAKTAEGDQLVTALGGICSGYQEAGRLLYKHAMDHLRMQGMLLNCVQQVLISYTMCLLKDKDAQQEGGSGMDDEVEENEYEKRGKELVKNLLPHLHLWLSRPDPRTQQLTLQLLTGRDASIRRDHDASGAPRVSRGLLDFIDQEDFQNDHTTTGGEGQKRGSGLMRCIHSMWPTFTSASCVRELRHAFYSFLQDVCDQKVFWESRDGQDPIGQLRSILVVGLNDSDDDVRQGVFDWWNCTGLSKDPHERFAEVFAMRPPETGVQTIDEGWLENSVALVLQLCRDSPSNSNLLFVEDLAYSHRVNFKKREISTGSLVSGSMPMSVPMFASSLPFSQVAATQSMSLFGGSQSQRTQGGSGGELMATLAGSLSDRGSMMTLETGSNDYLANQTLQADDTALFVPRRKTIVRPAAVGQAQRRRGAFAQPRLTSQTSAAAAENAERHRQARLAEGRSAAALRSKQNSSRKVTIARQYRTGEIPDIQIKLQDIVKPLQELALKDTGVSKVLLNVLFGSVLELKTQEEAKKEMKEKMKPEIIHLLNRARSSDLIGAVLDLAKTADFLGGEGRIQANVITSACKRAQAFYDGIKALELQAIQPLSPGAEPTGKRLSLSGSRDKRKHGGQKDTHMGDNDWKQLSELYKELEETDVVRGLFDKFSKHPDTKKALVHELDGQYLSAKERYEELMTKRDKVEEGEDTWEQGQNPTELEEDLWEDGYEESMRKAHLWEDLSEWCMLKVGPDSFDEDIWKNDNRRLLHIHLDRLIGACSISAPTASTSQGVAMSDDWKCFAGMIEEIWFTDEGSADDPRSHKSKKIILRGEFEHQASLALLICNPPNRVQAKELINGALSRFLLDWSSSSETGQTARRGKIRHLQKVVELLEFNEAGDDLEKLQQLMKLWGSRLPRKSQLGDIESWDSILVSRLTLLRGMSVDPRLSDEAVRTLRKTLLAMSSLARRRGNFEVADKMLQQTDLLGVEPGRMKDAESFNARSNALKLALAKACACASEEGKREKILAEAYTRIDQVEERELKLAAGAGASERAALKRFLALSGEICRQAAGKGDEGRRPMLHDKARERYQAALDEAQKEHEAAVKDGLDVSAIHRKDAKIHLAFASFCDAQIRMSHCSGAPPEGVQQAGSSAFSAGGSARAGKRQKSGGRGSIDRNLDAPDRRDDVALALQYIENLLAAIQKGSTVAQENFPRTLELLVQMQDVRGADSLWDKWAEGCSKLPASALIRWLPQLVSHWKRSQSDSSSAHRFQRSEEVIMQICEHYPQAVYMSVRVLKYEVPALWERITRSGDCASHASLEKFCVALRHLQHPEDQLANLRGIIGLKQTHKEIFDEICADFGKDANVGDYRKTFNNKHKDKWRNKLEGGSLPADAPALFVELGKLGRQEEGAAKRACGCKMPLSRMSKVLHDFEGSGSDAGALIVPGQHLAIVPLRSEDGAPKLSSCDPELLTMQSKARPKRLIMRGSDGKEYWWLAKGGEDLRQDERLMQIFASINRMLSVDVKCSQRRLALATYAVIPVSKRVGLLEWVMDTKPLKDLCDFSDQDAKNVYTGATMHNSNSKGWEGYKKCFYGEGAKDGIDKKFMDIIQKIPDHFMRQSLMSQQPSAHAHFLLRANFASSLATMNASHYLLGIGDRHDGNTLITDRGQLVGIDFGMAFGKGVWDCPVPELVPFRLTKQMLGVLAPLDSKALLKRSMTSVVSALRDNRHLLKQNLSIFLDDPTMDWIVDNNKKRQIDEGEQGQSAGARARGQSKGAAGDRSFLRERMRVLDLKLGGSHPCDVMEHDLQSSTWQHVSGPEPKKGISAILARARRSQAASVDGTVACSAQNNLNPSEQVDALITLATHPATLGRIWEGWSPWK